MEEAGLCLVSREGSHGYADATDGGRRGEDRQSGNDLGRVHGAHRGLHGSHGTEHRAQGTGRRPRARGGRSRAARDQGAGGPRSFRSFRCPIRPARRSMPCGPSDPAAPRLPARSSTGCRHAPCVDRSASSGRLPRRHTARHTPSPSGPPTETGILRVGRPHAPCRSFGVPTVPIGAAAARTNALTLPSVDGTSSCKRG